MNSEEYRKLFALEQKHWFFTGKRKIVKTWIKRFIPLDQNKVVLDVGACSGFLVEELNRECLCFGVESSPFAIQLAKQDRKIDNLILGSALSLPFSDQSCDVVLALDVLEHVENDFLALSELVRVTKKNGLILLTVPAMPWAMSDWDKSLGHFRRYFLRSLRQLSSNFPLLVLHQNYINTFLFFPVVLYRKLRTIFRVEKYGRLEDFLPNKWVNKILYYLFVGPALLKWPKMPFGLSALIIFRKT